MEKKPQLKKVLIITYYWVPMGGSGVQRWLKFSKYLPENGWQPIIYTPSNPDFPLQDKSLVSEVPEECEVIKQPIWEPYRLAALFSNKKNLNTGMFRSSGKSSWKDKLMNYVRSNYFIPDPRIFWVKKSIRFLTKYLKENPVDVIITNGPPHSMHLIGLGLKKKLGIRWAADFRDPWTKIDFYHTLNLTKRSDKKHHQLEKEVISNADLVTVAWKLMQDDFSVMNDNVQFINNGYDNSPPSGNIELDKKFTIAHLGIMNQDRNPKTLWEVLRKIGSEHPEFLTNLQIKLVGKVSPDVIDSINENQLDGNLNLIEYIPHQQVHALQQTSQILLLVINNTPTAQGIIPGKVFEYLASKRPIIVIGPDMGDSAKIVEGAKAGKAFNYDSFDDLEKYILESYNKYRKGELISDSVNIEKYSRRNLTKDLAGYLNLLT